MPVPQTPSQQIVERATSWPGVATATGDRGELAITLGRRQLGHLHGDHAAHFSFPKPVWRELREQGRIYESVGRCEVHEIAR